MKKLVIKMMLIVFVTSLGSCTDSTDDLMIKNEPNSEFINSDLLDRVSLTDPDDDGTDDEEEQETGLSKDQI